jgi:hypothetical protein
MVVHTYHPSIWGLKQEDVEFEARLGYIVRPCLKCSPPACKKVKLV